MSNTFFRALVPALALLLAAPAAALAQFDWLPLGRNVDRLSLAEQEAGAREAMQEAERDREAGRLGSASKQYQALAKRYPASSFAPHALFKAGTIEADRGRTKRAFEIFQRLLQGYPDFQAFNDVLGQQFDLATAMMASRRRLLFFRWGDQETAISSFEQVIANAPYSEYAPLALMNIATVYGDRGDTDLAIDALDRMVNFYPSSMLASDAYLNLAKTYSDMVDGPAYDQGATREAISYYQDFLILFPESPQLREGEEGLSEMREMLARSKFDIGRYYYRHMRNVEAAKIFLNEAITAAPTAPSAERARELLTKLEALPPPPPPGSVEAQPKRRFNLLFWRKPKPEVVDLSVEEKPLAQDYSRGDRPDVASETIQGAQPATEEGRSWLGNLWPFGRKRDEAAPAAPAAPAETAPAAPAPAPLSPPTRP